MSDVEEPPSKVTKYQLESQYLEGEVMEEGQEEWLSEGILTDDDYPAPDQDDSNLANASQADSANNSTDNIENNDSQEQTTDQTHYTIDEALEKLQSQETEEHLNDSQGSVEHLNGQENELNYSQGNEEFLNDSQENEQLNASQENEEHLEEHLMDENVTDCEDNLEGDGTKLSQATDNGQGVEKVDEAKNIEETLNDFENSKQNDQIQDELPGDLNTFLIRKTDGKVVEEIEAKDNLKESKPSDDDGNDTDDLLRMLGDGGEKKKKALKAFKKEQRNNTSDDDDDDEYIFESAKMKTLKVAKNALIRKYPATKAEPEDDMSTDEESTVMRVPVRRKEAVKRNSISSPFSAKHSSVTAKHSSVSAKNSSVSAKHSSVSAKNSSVSAKHSSNAARNSSVSAKHSSEHNKSNSRSLIKPALQKTPARHIVNVVQKPKAVQSKPAHSTSLRQHPSKRTLNQSLLKPVKPIPDEVVMNEEEFLEENDFDLDEDFAETDLEPSRMQRQRIMRPEEMDEEVPTDADSESDDESLYDELPSSDSDDMDDWFTLDIRAERAGDYIPLLGEKAYKLLQDEKRRVAARLTTLKKSLSSLTNSGRQQAEQLSRATSAMAELDAMLKAT